MGFIEQQRQIQSTRVDHVTITVIDSSLALFPPWLTQMVALTGASLISGTPTILHIVQLFSYSFLS